MKRHLIWIIAGTAAIGLAVPALASVGPNPTRGADSNQGEVRGNCDEAEHAGDLECLTVHLAAPTAPTVTPVTTAPTVTVQVTIPNASAPTSTTSATVPSNTTGTVPDNSSVGTAPSNTVNSVPGDISGPCDEAEHVNDPRCTEAVPSDDDDSGHGDDDDDDSGHGSDDD